MSNAVTTDAITTTDTERQLVIGAAADHAARCPARCSLFQWICYAPKILQRICCRRRD